MFPLPTRALRGRAPLLAAAASGWLALAVLAAHLQGEGAVEIAFLARWAAAVLVPLALAAPRPGLEVGATSLLLNLVAWVVPVGPQRGAAFGALLAAGVAVAAARLLAAAQRREEPDLRLAPLAVAVQALFAADRLLAPSVALLWTDVGPALAAGLALARLARRHGPAAFVGGGLAAVALGGLGPLTALLLLLAAAADAWQSPSPRRRTALLTGALAASLVLLPRGEAAFLPALLPLALLAPASLRPPPSGRTRDLWLGGWLLAIAGAATVASPAALAPALLLLGLALAGDAVRTALAGVWSGWLLGAAALAAGFPWLAAAPVTRLLELLGAPSGGALLPLACAAAGALFAFTTLAALATRWPALVSPRALALLPPILLAAAGFARPEVPLIGPEPVILGAASPAWSAPLAGPPPRAVVVEVALAGAAALPRGTEVARLELVRAGAVADARPLLAGVEVADWAARRPDVAARLGAPPATAWLAWPAPHGMFFAHRYRILWTLPGAASAPDELRVRLESDLPSDLVLALHRVGVRR